jgi:two-component system NarL family sensor kinase
VRLLTNPLAQLVAALLLAFVLVASLSTWLSQRAAQREAIADARSVTTVLAQGVVEPAIPRGLAQGDESAAAGFGRTLQERLQTDTLRRIKLWAEDGTVVWSDEPRLVGDHFAFDSEEREVLEDGGSEAEVSDLTKAENRFEPRGRQLVEVYTRVRSPEGRPMLFEGYYSLADVTARRHEISRAFLPVTLGATLVLTLLTAPIAWWVTRRMRRQAASREVLLQAAIDSSEAERGRIARDLHDGVVQDLAGAAFSLAGAARAGASPEELDRIGDTVRGSLRGLRSLLVEIYPPDLEERGLEGALTDLLAPAVAAGVHTELDLDAVPAPVDQLLWRVSQEAVRNAVAHASPTSITVTLRRLQDRVRLVVEDDGTGFDASAVPAHGHLGLRALRDTVREAGGTLAVESRPGEGTRVVLEVGQP